MVGLFLQVLMGEKGQEMRNKLDTPVDLSRLKVHFGVDDGGFPLISPVQSSIKKALLSAVHHLTDVCKAELVLGPSTCIKPLRCSADIWMAMMAEERCHKFTEDMANREGEVNAYVEMIKWLLGQSEHTFPAVGLGLMETITDPLIARR